jgi:hypothetical protein
MLLVRQQSAGLLQPAAQASQLTGPPCLALLQILPEDAATRLLHALLASGRVVSLDCFQHAENTTVLVLPPAVARGADAQLLARVQGLK